MAVDRDRQATRIRLTSLTASLPTPGENEPRRVNPGAAAGTRQATAQARTQQASQAAGWPLSAAVTSYPGDAAAALFQARLSESRGLWVGHTVLPG